MVQQTLPEVSNRQQARLGTLDRSGDTAGYRNRDEADRQDDERIHNVDMSTPAQTTDSGVSRSMLQPLRPQHLSRRVIARRLHWRRATAHQSRHGNRAAIISTRARPGNRSIVTAVAEKQ